MSFLAAVTVFVMMATGLVLYRRMARILMADDVTEPPERDLLLLGILPGFALAGIAVTYLSLFHLLRLWVVITLAVGVF